WTKGAEKIFSIDKKEIIGQPITNYFTRENLEILNTLETGESVHRHQHHARDDLAVLINSNPIVYKDKIIGAVVSETDITNIIRQKVQKKYTPLIKKRLSVNPLQTISLGKTLKY